MKAIASGYLSPQVQWERYDFEGAVDPELGQEALSAGVYSRGTDFTSWRVKNGSREAGSSMMRKLWNGAVGEEYCGVTVWAMRGPDGKLIGAVTWERANDQQELLLSDQPFRSGTLRRPRKVARARCLGRAFLFLAAPWRQKGLMGALIAEQVAPALEKAGQEAHRSGAFPFLRCGDAAPDVLGKYLSIPMPGHCRPCLSETETVRGWCARAGLEMDGFDHWKVPWRDVSPPPRKRAVAAL